MPCSLLRKKLNGGEALATPMTSVPRAFTSSSLSAMAVEIADRETAVAKSTAATLPPTQVGPARLAHFSLRNPGKPGFRGGEGRPRERSERGRGGGPTLVRSKWRPPPPTPPRHALRARGEGRRM